MFSTFHDLAVFESTSHLFCRMSLNLASLMFLHDGVQVMLGRDTALLGASDQKAHDVLLPSTGRVNFVSPSQMVSARLLLCTGSVLPLVISMCLVGKCFEAI